ncbi:MULTISPECIES: 4-(cytidine 5'-diphospho)-2-C-methyl-D-erythritol kinase [Eubacterium]|uniref:4-diphosphocytidyl-2-C-methyl-D-erythritol kinase n=1 Tax=Eubacterium album TaxID=2978477 RepID=A0ABT2M1Z4_9FIRM|nr:MULTISPECIES: 4-(cytidine 5'-diphospho)-2-C-methyl-D-erythritol kinase [unclassified Eubacterium (in: firmicutes)]MCT7399550.1 4-(cytidine 5'-diphospho)-2-C-methyl-D-erythritol kinase [Eubacterium sp. LFL-14]RGG62491.1 4-(cytidine 5'-diphospho)-2-C-methyl-D-erythritol kinase [Eubacterium sp. AF17-7]RHR32197.1 4-(cytidine 5'-diphospho)-2-C-methyl-D-erythritol kinase [Eubacterium sp. AF19-12LB]CDA29466.1 4-diphosphocytidyl-2-C-methyl-D-erythritol kinase [Eubacterium sp. CAG:156]
MDKIELKAYGKINIGLDVIRKREDGYHDLDMIMQTVGVYDDVIISREDGTQTYEIEVSTDADILPNDKGNLAFMAAKVLMEAYDIKSKVKIHINKRIPIAGGMAGGSADCAAVLRGVNKLFQLGLTDEQLQEYGVKLGADVPYCIVGGTKRAQGIGEILTDLPTPPKCYVIIAKPDAFVSTKFVYSHIRPAQIENHPDIDGIIESIKAGDLYGMCEKIANVMEDVTIPEYPIIQKVKDILKSNGAVNALMSGSGPTVFGIYDDEEKAKQSMDALSGKEFVSQLYLTKFI